MFTLWTFITASHRAVSNWAWHKLIRFNIIALWLTKRIYSALRWPTKKKEFVVRQPMISLQNKMYVHPPVVVSMRCLLFVIFFFVFRFMCREFKLKIKLTNESTLFPFNVGTAIRIFVYWYLQLYSTQRRG